MVEAGREDRREDRKEVGHVGRKGGRIGGRIGRRIGGRAGGRLGGRAGGRMGGRHIAFRVEPCNSGGRIPLRRLHLLLSHATRSLSTAHRRACMSVPGNDTSAMCRSHATKEYTRLGTAQRTALAMPVMGMA
eukprot:803694-Rhodomonas_salina.6